MLAIPLISAKCERVFSSVKHLITNSRNCFKADIIEINKCLKSQYRRLKPKAFQRDIDPNINNLYKEEAAAKAAAKKDSNIISNADKEKDEEKDEEQDEQEGELSESDCGDDDDESDKGDAIEYIVIDD